MATDQMRVVRLWVKSVCLGNGHEVQDDRAGYGIVYSFNNEEGQESEADQINYGLDVTSHVADYEALIHGLRAVKDEHSGEQPLRIEVFGDAKSLLRQVRGEYDVNKTHLFDLRRETRSLLMEFEEWSLNYVGKEESPELQKAYQWANKAARSDEEQKGGDQDG